MKVMVIGASGTIGKFVSQALAARHEIIEVGRSGAHRADIADRAQVEALFDKVGKVDAVVVAAGALAFLPLAEMTTEQFMVGINSKLMGQVNVAMVAQRFLKDGGSITLTSGSATEAQLRAATSASMVNNAIEGFARNAAVELPRGIRINVVSPALLDESVEDYGHLFAGVESVPGKRVAQAYVRSVEGAQTGQVYKIW